MHGRGTINKHTKMTYYFIYYTHTTYAWNSQDLFHSEEKVDKNEVISMHPLAWQYGYNAQGKRRKDDNGFSIQMSVVVKNWIEISQEEYDTYIALVKESFYKENDLLASNDKDLKGEWKK